MWNIQKRKSKNDEALGLQGLQGVQGIIPERVAGVAGVDFDPTFKNVKTMWYESLWWKIERDWNFIRRIPREIKWFFQRAIRGWADCDTWSFDGYLSKIISQGLKRLKAHKMGYPSRYTEKEWDEVIDCMVRAFETAMKVTNNELDYVPQLPPESLEDSLWKSIEDIARKYGSRCMTKEEEAEMKKGFQLFIENFFSFWD